LRNDTASAQIGLRFRVSERMDFEASAGESRTRARGLTDRERNYHAALSWRGELANLEFSLGREVQPSGRGVLVNADDIRFSYSRQLSERWDFSGSLRASRREDLLFQRFSNDYYYGAATLTLTRQLDENWKLGLGGAYTRQDYELAAQAADGTRLGLTLSWQPLQ
jgi:hypothetical protein